MKKVLYLIAAIAVMAACVGPRIIKTERFVQAVNSPSTLWYSYSQSGTLTINKSDGLAGVTIIVPSSATDSVLISGKHLTIDGKASGSGRVAPGTSVGIGYNDLQRIDSVTLTIRAHSMPTIILSPVK
jgi:hypothetical protein